MADVEAGTTNDAESATSATQLPGQNQEPKPQEFPDPEDRNGKHTNGDKACQGDLQLLSKNQQKKLKRRREWEQDREARKVRRKEKAKAKKERLRAAANDQNSATPDANPSARIVEQTNGKEKPFRSVQLPVTFVMDCQFDDLMTDGERISLASQLTRCYSDNKKAPYRAHLAVSSFGGQLKDRFDNALHGNHTSWQGVRFRSEDFVQVAQEADSWMKDVKKSGRLAGAFEKHQPAVNNSNSTVSTPDNGAPSRCGDVIYLSSESPETLDSLQPYTTYIIGGLVDKNRHKGLCYKRALDRGVRTAKLPIGEYLKMQSRFVLTTNQVNEIMLKWLEYREWSKAFVEVMPKRKGGLLKSEAEYDKSEEQAEDEEGKHVDLECSISVENGEIAVINESVPQNPVGAMQAGYE